jgi:DNA-binding GntR family transcriptional regulator
VFDSAKGPSYLPPVRTGPPTAHEFVRETLRRAIMRGELGAGTRLIQAEVAAQLRVSTTPVREAMRDLATEGLITLDRHRGGIVRGFNWDDVQEILAVRRCLEPLAVQLAMTGVTDEDLERAAAMCDELESVSDPGTWVELNQQFHFIFHDATGNSRLTELLKSLQVATGIYVAQAQRWNPELREQANRDHRALIAACRARDLETALEVQLRHICLPIDRTIEEAVTPESDSAVPSRADGARAAGHT